MTTKVFNINDRVACYGQPTCGSFVVPSMEGDKGAVVGKSDEWLTVKLDQDYGSLFRFHPKQCRHLKPKKNKGPMRIFLRRDICDFSDYRVINRAISNYRTNADDIEFIEVTNAQKDK